jgi:hypothetical protein
MFTNTDRLGAIAYWVETTADDNDPRADALNDASLLALLLDVSNKTSPDVVLSTATDK